MKIEGLDHVHLAVRSLEKATQFFQSFLGVKASPIYHSEEGEFRFRFLRAGRLVLQLMEPLSPQSPISRLIEQRGEGLHAVSFKVDNLEATVAELQGQGLRLMGKSDAGAVKQAHFHPAETFGLMVELCQYPGRPGSIMELFKKGQGR